MLAIFLAFITFFGASQSTQEKKIHYQIKPVPTADRTNLEITFRFKIDEKQINIKLPTDYYGTPNLHQYVTSLTGETGTIVRAGKTENERIVEPNKNGEVRLKYNISYPPIFAGTFSPNVSAKHFHVAGCQWALQIGEFEQEHLLKVELINIPSNWQMYSSLGANPLKFETKISYQNLIATAIGGGEKQNFQQFKYKEKPVSVFIQGKFDIPNQEIFDAVQKIVALQRDWFSDYTQPFYNVVILPKEDNIAGTRIENQFICFIKKDITRQQLYVLLSHEMFHNWLDSSLIKPEKGVTSLRYAWFHEGVNEYFARKLLLEANLLSQKEFADLFNQDVLDIADNPNRAATFDDLLAATKTGKYNQAFNKMSYYRGALIALNWEAQIGNSKNGKTLGDLIREAYFLSKKNNGISETQFFELANKYGINAQKDFESYILRGEPINLEPDAFGKSFVLRETNVPKFEPGFNLRESLKNKKIIELKEDSAAFRAGLRNEMKLIEIENENRFSNAWNPNKSLVVIVEIDGREKRFEIHFEKSHKLLLFEEIK